MLGTMIGDERLRRPAERSERGGPRARSASVNRSGARRAGHDRPVRARHHDARHARRAGGDRPKGDRRARPAAPTGCAPPPTSSGPAQTLAEVASMQAADTPERLDRYEARLRAFPAYLDAWGDVAREGIADGVTSPRLVTERAVAQLERLLSLAPEDSPAIAPLAEDDAAKERIADVVRDTVNPAFARYRETLREYLPHCTETIGLSALPGGDELYAASILAWTTLPLDPHDVHELGLERYAGIQEERARDRRSRSGTRAPPTRSRRIRRAGRTRRPPARRCWRWRASRSSGAGRPPARSSDACRTPTATSGRSRSSGSRTRRSASTTRRPRTDRGAARTTSTPRTCQDRPLHHIASLTYHEANPGPSLPALDRAGAPRPARAPAVRRHPRQQRVRGRVGSVQRAPRRGDGPVPGRLGAARHARGAGDARRAVGHRHGDPRAGMVARAARSTRWRRSARRTSTRSIEVDRYIAIPGQALVVHDRHDRDRARPGGRDRARGRGVLAPRLPRPVARARPAAAPGAATRARLDRSTVPAGRAEA